MRRWPNEPVGNVPELSIEAARRIALAASMLSGPRPERVTAHHLKKVLDTLGVVQIDSVARVVRSHYLPFFSRLGPYPMSRLDRLLHVEHHAIEYWTHEAAYARPEVIAAFDRTREEWFRHDYGQRDAEHGADFRTLMADVEEALVSAPGTARELDSRIRHDIPEGDRDHWGWNPSRVKSAAEALFRAGRISVTARNRHFERVYALPGDVSPALPLPPLHFGPASEPALGATPGIGSIPRGISGVDNDLGFLVTTAAKALGVATTSGLADYFRQPVTEVRPVVADLEARGILEPVRVAGLRAHLWPDARRPRRVEATALLAPFDPFVFDRRRIAWLFDFDYRIEIYTPAVKRRYGYYVLPFLFGERLVARVDLARHAASRTLRVEAVHWEPWCAGEERLRAASALEGELEAMRTWLDLDEVWCAPHRPNNR